MHKLITTSIVIIMSLSLQGQASWIDSGNNQLYFPGQVAIGSSVHANAQDGYLLSVNGKIACEEVLIQLAENWADYVFAPGYPLIDIDKLPKYLSEHGHLPGMPTAAEVANNGLDMSKATGNLLARMEELSLYLIEDLQRDENLERTIKQLQEQLR